YAEEDFRQRQLIEARNEAETILHALDKGRHHLVWHRLSKEESKEIAQGEAELNRVKAGQDHKQIRAAIEELNKVTMRLADLMMDSAVSTALKGKSMDQTEFKNEVTAPHPIAPAEIK
ncbi:MAG TPA: Hsp70 family protein, partial [Candidatus Angelobacter sp.]